MMHMKATTNEEHIAKVSETKNAQNAIFPDMMGNPCFKYHYYILLAE